jgi:hypothetical protein
VLSRIATAYLIPDNHVGRATVSSVAVAHEVDLTRFGEEYQGRPDAFRAGITTRLRPVPPGSGKQTSSSSRCRSSSTSQFDGDIYVGVMVVPSTAMARKLMVSLPEITV